MKNLFVSDLEHLKKKAQPLMSDFPKYLTQSNVGLKWSYGFIFSRSNFFTHLELTEWCVSVKDNLNIGLSRGRCALILVYQYFIILFYYLDSQFKY